MYIYFLCPVRKVTPEVKRFLDDYVSSTESQGHHVHYPHRDVEQNDPTGLTLMLKHREAMKNSNEVHAFWTGSEGQVCDLGMALALNKPLRLVNKKDVEEWLGKNPGKSFTRVAYELDNLYHEISKIK